MKERPESRATQGQAWALVIGATAVAALIRLYGIFRHPFEQDELYTWLEATHLLESPLKPGIEGRPLFYLMQHVVLNLAPVTHLSMRILPLLFGLAGVAVTVWLALRYFGRAAAGTTAAIITLSAWHIHISGMARYWSLVYLLSALGMWALLSAHRSDRTRDYLLASLALALGLASHPTVLFPFVGVVLALHLRPMGRGFIRWPGRNEWIGLWLPLVSFVVVAYLLLSLTGRESAVRNFEGRGVLASLRLLPAIVEWLTPAVLAAAVIGAILSTADRSSPERRRWGLMSLLGMGSTLVLLAAASTTTDVYADYGAAMLPLAFVSVGGLVQLMVERLRQHRAAATAAATLVLLAAMAPSTVSHLSDGMRFDPRPAFQAVAMSADDNRLLLSSPITLQRHYAPELRGGELRTRPAALDRVLAEEGGFWAAVPVRRYGIVNDPDHEGARWLSAHCTLERSFERPRFDFRMYRVDLYRCGDLRDK